MCSKQFLFDFFNQERQVGPGKTEAGRGNAVVLDVRRDVFVVRVGGGQRCVIGMGPGVIPIQDFFVGVSKRAVF